MNDERMTSTNDWNPLFRHRTVEAKAMITLHWQCTSILAWRETHYRSEKTLVLFEKAGKGAN